MDHETTRNGRDYSRREEEAPAPAAPSAYPSLKPLGLHKSLPAIPINRPITMIGSRRTARVHLNSGQVSKAHALIVMTPTKAYVCDLLSREGTRVKGHAIKELELRDGDELQLGDFKFQFRDPRPRQKSPPPAVEPLALQITTPAGAQRIVLEKRVTLIGRRNGSDIELPMPDVSTANTAIVRLDGFAGEGKSMAFVGWGIFDLGGKGTEVNGRPVHKGQIRAGDLITIGGARIQVVSLLHETTERVVPSRAAERVARTRPEPEVPAVAASPVAPIPIVEQPVTAEDLDAIALDEDLTPEGVEVDLLGGSHILEAIAEPAETSPLASPASEELGTDGLEELLQRDDLRPPTAAPPSRPRLEEQEAEQDYHEPHEEAEIAAAVPSRGQPTAEVDLSSIDFVSSPEAHAVDAPGVDEWQGAAAPAEEFATAGVTASLEIEGATARYTEADEQRYVEPEPEHPPVEAEFDSAGHLAAESPFVPEPQLEEPSQATDGTEAFAGQDWSDSDRQPAQIFIEPEAQLDLIEPDADQQPTEELGVREGELDIDGAPAEPPPVESEVVIGETEPTPQSALDLEPLAADPEPQTFEHAPAPALSDSAFAMELEALTEEGGMYGRPAPEAQPELAAEDQAGAFGEAPAEEPRAPQIEFFEPEIAHATDAEPAWQAEPETEPTWQAALEAEPEAEPAWQAEPESEPSWQAQPEAEVAAEDGWQAEPEAQQDPQIEWAAGVGAEAEPADEAIGQTDFAPQHFADDAVEESVAPSQETAPEETYEASAEPVAEAEAQSEPQPAASEPDPAPPRDSWRLEQATFLGNMRSLGDQPHFSMPVSATANGPAARAVESPPPNDEVEHQPEAWEDENGRDPDLAAPAPWPDADHAPEPSAAAVPTQQEDLPVAAEPPVAQDQPPKPRKIGFAGAVAEIDEPVAPGAATPFSSRPVAAARTSFGDPSMLADDFALESPPPAKPPVPEPAKSSSASVEPAESAGGPAVAEPEEEDFWAHLPREAEQPPADRYKTAHKQTNGQAHAAAPDEQQARMDDFLNTIRAGVRGSRSEPAPADSNSAQTPDDREISLKADRPRGSVHGQPDWAATVSPLGEPLLAESGDDEGGSSRLLWQIPVLILAAFVAAAGAAAGIWYGVQPTVTVAMKLRYDFPAKFSQDARRAYEEEQRALVVEDSIRQLALAQLKDGSPQVSPGFLDDVTAYNRFALNVNWSDSDPDALLLSREVPVLERAAESARLKAVATALFDHGASTRAAREQSGGQIQQLENELARALSQLDDLTRQIEEAVARLPLPRDATSDVAQEQALEERIARLDEQWSAASRRAVQLREQMTSLQQADPLADDRQLAELNRQLTDVEAQIAIFRRRAPQSDEPASNVEPEPLEEEDAVPAALDILSGLIPETQSAPAIALLARPAGAPLQGEIQVLLKQIDAVAADMPPAKARQLGTQAGAFAALLAGLVDETLPAQVRIAGEVELLRQSLLRTRRQRSIAMLDEDANVRTLRAEAALKERELNAAISDGLTDKAAGLRMALRLTRDRLSMRVDEVTARLEDDAKVVATWTSYEAALRSGRDTLVPQREQFEKAVSSQRAVVESVTSDEPLLKALTRLETAARTMVEDHAIRLPLMAEVWASPAERAPDPKPAAEQPPAAAPPAQDGDAEQVALVFHAGQDLPIPSTQPSLEQQAAELRRQIADRKTQLTLDQDQHLAEIREQLAAAEAAAAKSQREAQEARGQLAEMRSGQELAIRERQRVSQLRMDKVDLESNIAQKHRELERTRAATGALVTPLPPADVDLLVPVGGDDPRPRLIMIAVSIIACLTIVGLFLTLRSSARG